MDVIARAVEFKIVDEEFYRDLAVKASKQMLESYGYKCYETLGKGSFGEVIQVENKRKLSKEAVKVVLNNRTSKSETDVWPKLKNNYILPLLGQVKFLDTSTTLFFSPLCQGTLSNKLEDDKFLQKQNSFRVLRKYLHNILSGLEYIHGQKMNHLDVKMSNILIKTDGTACICDLGCICEADTLVDRLVITLTLHLTVT